MVSQILQFAFSLSPFAAAAAAAAADIVWLQLLHLLLILRWLATG